MNLWLGSVGFATAALSAIALYAGSPHCPSPMRRHRARTIRVAGVALAVLSLAAWTQLAGFGAGLCTMLACWMLSLTALPYLALLRAARLAPSVKYDDVG